MFLLRIKKINGKYNGNIKINVSAYVLLDRKNKFQSNQFKAFLFFLYNNIIIKDKIENVHEDRLYSEVLDFINNLKKYINIK